jgi:hypothetical protein
LEAVEGWQRCGKLPRQTQIDDLETRNVQRSLNNTSSLGVSFRLGGAVKKLGVEPSH